MRQSSIKVVLIVSVIISACAHQPKVSSFPDSMHPIGQGWFLDKLNGPDILFRKQTKKGMYHTVVAYGSFERIGETIEGAGGTRRDIGNVTELQQYIRKKTDVYQGQRFKNADSKILIERYLGNDCVRVDFRAEDHAVPGALGSIFSLMGKEYYCLHPTSTESSASVTHLHVSQRYLRGEEPLPLDAEVEPFFRSYVEGSTIPLIKAAKEGDIASVQKIIARGVDVNSKADIISDWGKTALMEASLRGYADIVTALLKAGADVNAKDDYGDTALVFAAGKGHYDIVKLLLNAGGAANVQTTGSKSTALMVASKNGYTGVVQLLLDAGADINIREEGGTALTLAAWKGAIPIMQLLIERGADVNAQSGIGMTALMYTAAAGNTSIVQTLIEKGADVNAKDKYGHTVLEFSKRHPKIVELLKKAGVKE
jgi:ankyrin repeat protein